MTFIPELPNITIILSYSLARNSLLVFLRGKNAKLNFVMNMDYFVTKICVVIVTCGRIGSMI